MFLESEPTERDGAFLGQAVDATIINRSRTSPDLPELLAAELAGVWNLPTTSDSRRGCSTRGTGCDGPVSHMERLAAAARNPSGSSIPRIAPSSWRT